MSVAAAVAAAGVVAASATPAYADSYLVTNTNDAGGGSLRRAILSANQQPDTDTIRFGIADAGPHTITLAANLPPITQPLTIDGYTQPGATEASDTNVAVPQVVIDASAASVGLELATNDSVVRGLVVQKAAGWLVADGIRVWGDRNRIEGNFVGTGAVGARDGSGNEGDGVQISGHDNVVGGTEPEDRNVLADNDDAGVRIPFSSDTGNVIENNLIGTDATGTQPAGNNDGVAIAGEDNLVGGTTPEARNVIADNWIGVHLTGDANRVEGNAIGTDITTTAQLENEYGVWIESDDNQIGASGAGAGNVISGNNGYGVRVQLGAGNRLEGNLIGPDGNGAPLIDGEDQVGVRLESSYTVVGGPADGASNVISGNVVGLEVAGDLNDVLGNKIGTDADGETALPNAISGIVVTGDRNLVGGPDAGEANVVSGNGVDGIEVRVGDLANPVVPWGNRLMGNLIGTNARGNAALPNAGDGVELSDAMWNQIGGEHFGEGNIISGNGGHGVRIETVQTGNADLNVIVGNKIGTNHSLVAGLGNGDSGVYIEEGNDNRVGTQNGPNTIAFNGGDGVSVETSVNNSIIANSIYDNTDLGIDLDDNGATPNDPFPDPDTGANDRQNYPLINFATQTWPPDTTGTVLTTLNWTLQSAAFTDYRIEFFASPRCDELDAGQAKTFLGAREVTTNAMGVASALATVIKTSPNSGGQITATATNIDNPTRSPEETSELSPCTRATLR
jgi:hypothetical protein